MELRRACGVLLHPTSLPGGSGIGDMGAEAYRFIDFLAAAGQTLWQVLPLGPTGYGDSPYQCFSAFAGNPLLIDLQSLVGDGILEASELAEAPAFPDDRVDYGRLIPYKMGLLKRASQRFLGQASDGLRRAFLDFREEQAGWLEDYALYMALKETRGGAPWVDWEPDLVARRTETLEQKREELAGPILAHQYMQFEVFRQWVALKQYANARGVEIIGDIPIFVAHDSVDVWANTDMFFLDEAGRPTVVAGVPPDYFSATGQLWGNPLYRWDVLAADGYGWWIARVNAILEMVDYVRLDHFRGFEGYWEVPATETTAMNGRWVPGPGAALFAAIDAALGKLPLIAEDLGVITPEVEALRDQFEFPGMKILQFAFASDATNKDLPHNYLQRCVVYTGTHDNDTTMGWYTGSSEPNERDYCRRYMAIDGSDIAWDMIRLALSSVAGFALYPAQDLLSLGTDARMNFPSRPSGNWSWRLRPGDLHPEIGDRLLRMAVDYGRFLPDEIDNLTA